ncbi:hypothetical protein LOK49_LG10G01603 [Camellia lanceoleosa]|uniref:Uncharacterized protein n=1 Tax=Camellia lanceoleosa TaxID=1840588 RepID=A0ACC0G5Y0_9ERIC|nr:hypothetical protein LOK49_LG10G01603 [Camellia lanceoleosa]
MGRFSIPIMIGFVVVLLSLWVGITRSEYMKYNDPKQPLNVRINDLMKRMTVEEKIGQMVQIEHNVASSDVMIQYFIVAYYDDNPRYWQF